MAQSIKQTAIDALAKMPEQASIDEMMYRLYVIQKIEKGREDVKAGNVISHEDLKKEIEKW
jgi:predicted transcriptional regulator